MSDGYFNTGQATCYDPNLPNDEENLKNKAYYTEFLNNCLEDKRFEQIKNKSDRERLRAERIPDCCQQMACGNPEVIDERCPKVEHETIGPRFGRAKMGDEVLSGGGGLIPSCPNLMKQPAIDFKFGIL